MRLADSAPPNAPAQASASGGDGAWAKAVEALTGPVTITALTALVAALVAGAVVYQHMKAPAKARERNGRALMYVPLFLVNAAAVYGQVAYAYERIAPAVWNTASKLALAVMFAAAIESIAVYVGWHAHDALLQKATATAARLRRASYVLAAIVGAINYAHFADGLTNPTAASIAFGLLSLLSPWLWGLHTRRAQHVRLTREGAVDATGATFSGERHRMFPIRAYKARRWSVDNYVTDPRAAWEGYKADLARLGTLEAPWWARAAPWARVAHLEAALADTRAVIEAEKARFAQAADEHDRVVADLVARFERDMEQARLDTSERLRTIRAEATERASTEAAEATRLRGSVEHAEAEMGRLRDALKTRVEALQAEHAEAIQRLNEEHSERLAEVRAEAATTKLADYRGRSSGGGPKRPTKRPPKPRLSDEEAVQALLDHDSDPSREWSQADIVRVLGVGWGRAPRLLEAVTEELARRSSGGNAQAISEATG